MTGRFLIGSRLRVIRHEDIGEVENGMYSKFLCFFLHFPVFLSFAVLAQGAGDVLQQAPNVVLAHILRIFSSNAEFEVLLCFFGVRKIVFGNAQHVMCPASPLGWHVLRDGFLQFFHRSLIVSDVVIVLAEIIMK